jgi:predicted lipoprotein with Yx(FWY)xxD motif
MIFQAQAGAKTQHGCRLAVLTALGLLALAGCGGSSSPSGSSPSTPAPSTQAPSSSSAATVQVSTKTVSGLGPVLVDAQGRTLYMFTPDKHEKVTCSGACATVWPPVKLSGGEKAVAAGEAKSSLLGSDPGPEGGQVVTYAGWPLYTYVGDSAAGSASGQALNTNGGLWYVLSPAGKVIEKTP